MDRNVAVETRKEIRVGMQIWESLIHRVNDADELGRQASTGRTNPRERQD